MANCKQRNQGLYQSDYEHDACGVGMVVNIHGGKSHDLVDNALKVLENMDHGTDTPRVYFVTGYPRARKG